MIRSLSGRVFLVLVLGIAASACLTLWFALDERQTSLIQSRESHYLDRAEQLVMAIDTLPTKNRVEFLKMLPRLGINIVVKPTMNGDQPPLSSNAVRLAERLGDGFKVASLWPAPCPTVGAIAQLGTCESVMVTLHDGVDLSLVLMPQYYPLPPVSPYFYHYLVVFLLFIAGLAFMVTRMVIRPLQRLSQAAVDLGNDINHPQLEVAGATELRQASNAFNAMQARIRNYIGQRTHMLAAITHDLQTPLTRLRLRIEKVSDDDLRDRLITDLSAMQEMVREGLLLARSMDTREQRQLVGLDSLLDSVVSDAIDAGQQVKLEGKSSMSVRAQPQALLRCVNNLIDNALKYGHYANVTVQNEANQLAVICVRDGGTGLPEEELEKVFTPFYRLESSRSRESGGTGLGLTIARNICEQHGGSLTLRNHPEGGLEAILKLPGNKLLSKQ